MLTTFTEVAIAVHNELNAVAGAQVGDLLYFYHTLQVVKKRTSAGFIHVQLTDEVKWRVLVGE